MRKPQQEFGSDECQNKREKEVLERISDVSKHESDKKVAPRTVAIRSELSRRKVHEAVKNLSEDGLLKKHRIQEQEVEGYQIVYSTTSLGEKILKERNM